MGHTYWSCTNFADWVRGTPKPRALTGSSWRRWVRQAKKAHPVRYWIAEEFLDAVQRFMLWPLDKWRHFKNYVNNRWLARTHALTAHPRDIKAGDWADLGYRILPCLFNELVNFVEVEEARHMCAWNEEKTKHYKAPKTDSLLREWRCPEAGMEYLDWAGALVHNGQPTAQALAAREIKSLYMWWKYERPKRPEPDFVSGYRDFFAQHQRKDWLDFEYSEAEERELEVAIQKTSDVERQYEAEDEEMMIRLIKIRHHLWT